METSLRADGSFNQEEIDVDTIIIFASVASPVQVFSVGDVATGTGSSEDTIDLESCQVISEAAKEAPVKASGIAHSIKESTYCFCGKTHVVN